MARNLKVNMQHIQAHDNESFKVESIIYSNCCSI